MSVPEPVCEVLRVTFKLYALRVYAGLCFQEIVGTLRTARAKVCSDVLISLRTAWLGRRLLCDKSHFIRFMRFNLFFTKWLQNGHYDAILVRFFSKSRCASFSCPEILGITKTCPPKQEHVISEKKRPRPGNRGLSSEYCFTTKHQHPVLNRKVMQDACNIHVHVSRTRPQSGTKVYLYALRNRLPHIFT